ncbi:chemotaxis protein CheA [Eubacteriales bacterium OttesenSCG-928-M02]|nr:chemotaxis protein CheA [Eubacteriales bacterium OttesenSCG-928-M02]
MSENDSMLEIYIYENLQLIEQLEGILLAGERADRFSEEQVGAIFRILHTIKGSSAMMDFDGLARLSHVIEDLFGYIRDHMDVTYDHVLVCDLVIQAADVIRSEIETLEAGGQVSADPAELIDQLSTYYETLKSGGDGASGSAAAPLQPAAPVAEASLPPEFADAPSEGNKFYKIHIFFEKDCKMENMRAFGVVRSVEEMASRLVTVPDDVLKDSAEDYIVANGFTMFLATTEEYDVVHETVQKNFFIDSLTVELIPPEQVGDTPLDRRALRDEETDKPPEEEAEQPQQQQQQQRASYMSVRLDKMDKLMDLVGEIVTTETTVTQNPDIVGLSLDNFDKAARQLRKLTDELQDTVMSIRMIPIAATFHRMERIVRDMAKKTNKQAELVIVGEDTEMDKTVIDSLGDPLMHVIRNAMDHGIEAPEDRMAAGKPERGRITLDARNTGGDIIITVSDDGKGMDRNILLEKGIEKGLVKKTPEEMSDREVFGLIFAAGFSTKEEVTEFSGRGVGMDVAVKNIHQIGGSITVDSELGKGTTVQMRIPLTLAIIDGMQISVGQTIFIVPLLSIRESFKPKKGDVFTDPDGNEMILIRGTAYRVVRLHQIMDIQTKATEFEDGILMLLEGDQESYCLFVDSLIGEQQTVIKPIPPFISRMPAWLNGIAGCTIMGDGSISLILDINNLA